MVPGSMKDKSVILLKSGAELLVIAIDKVTQGLSIMHPISFTQRFNISELMVTKNFDCLREINYGRISLCVSRRL